MLSALTLDDSTGTPVALMSDPKRQVVTATGLVGIGPVRTDNKRVRPTAHGGINEAHWQDGRVITIEGQIGSNVSVQDAYSELRIINSPMLQTLDVAPALLKWTEASAGNQLQMLVKLDGDVEVQLHDAAAMLDYQAHFFAEDPRAYTQALTTTDSTALSTSGGGLVIPEAFNWTFASSGGGTATVTNAGNRPTPPLFRVFGMAQNMQIVNLATQARIVLDGTVNAGDYLEVDCAKRTVKLNGTTSRLNFLNASQTTWFDLPSGVTNLQLIAGAFDGSALLRTLFRSAYA